MVRVADARVRVVRGDLTEQAVDVVVNAANPTLLGGGGVDGAIHSRGGPAIRRECEEIRATRYPEGLPTGEAVSTGAGLLPARAVIHTVGPIWRGGSAGEARQLSAAYRNSLRLAIERGWRVIAFPSISTGAYGYPVEEAAEVAVRAIITTLRQSPGVLDEVRLVLFSDAQLEVYRRVLERQSGSWGGE